MDIPFPPHSVAKRLLAWYGQHGRDLPWRQTRDPYRIWLSEIMLQQTTVTAVIPYYQKFLTVFPDVHGLAAAPLEQVLGEWAGLGYYSRARNLHAAARQVVDRHGGVFPDTVEALVQLPGIGRSTAGAIVSIAFDRPAPILDGNVRRVLARLMALRRPPRERAAENQLWAWAEALTPDARPHDYAQAIMDLGATICLPRTPNCADCPLAELCRAHLEGVQDELPVTVKKSALPIRREVVLLVRRDGRLLVRRRPPSGLLGGMWEFPCRELTGDRNAAATVQGLLAEYCPGQEAVPLGAVRHTYSHFRLEAEIFQAEAGNPDKTAESDTSFWHDEEDIVAGPLHGAHRKVLARFKESRE